MTATDPLAALKDIHLPPAVGVWPPAPGWWIAGALLLFSVIFLIAKLWQRWRARTYRRQALRQLQSIYGQWQHDQNDELFQQRVNQLLKQTALAAFPHTQVAALHGETWLRFLDEKLRKAIFSTPALRAFADNYRARAEPVAASVLHDAAQRWIRRHRC
jgi:hypothetical protein